MYRGLWTTALLNSLLNEVVSVVFRTLAYSGVDRVAWQSFGKGLASRIFTAFRDIEETIAHPDYKGLVSLEMAEAKVTEAAACSGYNAPLATQWGGAKQHAMFLERFLTYLGLV